MSGYLNRISGEPVWIVLGFFCPAFEVVNFYYGTKYFDYMYDLCVLDYWG